MGAAMKKQISIKTVDGSRNNFIVDDFDIQEFSSLDGNLYNGIPIEDGTKWFNLRNIVSITETEVDE